MSVSSPHARGCFPVVLGLLEYRTVFPACAGVFPALGSNVLQLLGLPRMRGGVSRGRQI